MNIGRITVSTTVKVKLKEHMLSMYTGGSQTTLEIRMTLLTVSDDMAVLTLLTVSDDIAVFTAKQLYCCTNMISNLSMKIGISFTRTDSKNRINIERQKQNGLSKALVATACGISSH